MSPAIFIYFNELDFLASAKEVMFSSLFVCLSVYLFVYLLAILCKNFRTALHESFREGWQWTSEQLIKFWWRSGSLSGYRTVFRIRHYWEIRKVVSTDCAARRCRAGHALAGIATATMTSLRHRPLAEVYTVPMLLVNYKADLLYKNRKKNRGTEVHFIASSLYFIPEAREIAQTELAELAFIHK